MLLLFFSLLPNREPSVTFYQQETTDLILNPILSLVKIILDPSMFIPQEVQHIKLVAYVT